MFRRSAICSVHSEEPKGPAAAERAAHRLQLSFSLTGPHFGSLSSATFRLGVSKFQQRGGFAVSDLVLGGFAVSDLGGFGGGFAVSDLVLCFHTARPFPPLGASASHVEFGSDSRASFLGRVSSRSCGPGWRGPIR
jgi:hypothetical protein